MTSLRPRLISSAKIPDKRDRLKCHAEYDSAERLGPTEGVRDLAPITSGYNAEHPDNGAESCPREYQRRRTTVHTRRHSLACIPAARDWTAGSWRHSFDGFAARTGIPSSALRSGGCRLYAMFIIVEESRMDGEDMEWKSRRVRGCGGTSGAVKLVGGGGMEGWRASQDIWVYTSIRGAMVMPRCQRSLR